jgi:CubicO group peptidase (beta-lactamase class C family)
MRGRPELCAARVAAAFVAAAACTPSAPGPDSDPFDAAARLPYITSLSVHRDGAVVREAYYHHSDASTPHDVRSVTKTITSLLIGIAIDTHCLRSLDQPIGEALGPKAPTDPAKTAITLRDLLTMSSGFTWLENGAEGYNAWITAPDQVDYVLARPLADTPGTVFNYNSGALHLLSVAITSQCAPTETFAAQHLFGPLGIEAAAWETDNQGLANGAAGVQLTTPALAAIGQLILDRGAVGGAQIVPAAYIDAATTRQISTDDDTDQTPGYGYGIWLAEPARGAEFLLAEGFGGQFIAIVPAAHAVVVATTRWEGVGPPVASNYTQLYDILANQIVPAL